MVSVPIRLTLVLPQPRQCQPCFALLVPLSPLTPGGPSVWHEPARTSRPPWRVCPAGQCSNRCQPPISEAHPPATGCCSQERPCFLVLQPRVSSVQTLAEPEYGSEPQTVGGTEGVCPSLGSITRGCLEEVSGRCAGRLAGADPLSLEKASGTSVLPPTTSPRSPRAWSGLLPPQPGLGPPWSGSLGGAGVKETSRRYGEPQPSSNLSSPNPRPHHLPPEVSGLTSPSPALPPAGRGREER